MGPFSNEAPLGLASTDRGREELSVPQKVAKDNKEVDN
jgi:hypothetical protein